MEFGNHRLTGSLAMKCTHALRSWRRVVRATEKLTHARHRYHYTSVVKGTREADRCGNETVVTTALR